MKRPNMNQIEEQFHIFEKPSASHSKDMYNYIKYLEDYLKKIYESKYEADKLVLYASRITDIIKEK